MYLGVWAFFLFIIFPQTQKIYSKNKLNFLFKVSIALPTVLFFMLDRENKFKAVCLGFLIFFYTSLLQLIKLNYKKLNSFLVQKKLVDIAFEGKDYTFSESGDYDDYWDKKLCFRPSWFDRLLSFLLIILPLLSAMLLDYFIG